ncbi:glycosyl hydrolase family 61-domain-containing protein [Auriculariales sp. MPI-PUGE-AT-0066]|nr:glycosyl hydrolase family 61-domain-containing protein [Auriculariales sp. MPI-PUGE-AT-0066]
MLMKWTVSALALVTFASQSVAHYTFPGFISNAAVSADWINVRMTNNHYSHGPVQDVTSVDLRCYTSENLQAATTANVTAGATVGFRVDPQVQHPGPLLVYMAKAPSTVDSWDGSGTVWFKIYEIAPSFASGAIAWPTDNLTQVTFPIPKSLPNGQYLLRVEHIALHAASSVGGAQFYIGCAQVAVTGGGSGSPSPTVAFPGAYKSDDPGILFQLYWPVPTAYVMPGPAVWTG